MQQRWERYLTTAEPEVPKVNAEARSGTGATQQPSSNPPPSEAPTITLPTGRATY